MYKEELETQYDRRKSFYGKAHVIHYDDGSIALQSYSTIVAVIVNGNVIRTWGGYSDTTRRHVNDFLYQNGHSDLIGKKNWDRLPTYYEKDWDYMSDEERVDAAAQAMSEAMSNEEMNFWEKIA